VRKVEKRKTKARKNRKGKESALSNERMGEKKKREKSFGGKFLRSRKTAWQQRDSTSRPGPIQ
jgi:hypothetical protein